MTFAFLNCSMLVCLRIAARPSARSLVGIVIGASGGSLVLVIKPVAGPARTDIRDSSNEHWISSAPFSPTIFHIFRFAEVVNLSARRQPGPPSLMVDSCLMVRIFDYSASIFRSPSVVTCTSFVALSSTKCASSLSRSG